ncbi:MAG: EAL domain-containing protein [Treponema sp.]|nr:EAL domain-containing protein [Treponema sp.]
MNDSLMCDITALIIFFTLIISNITKNRVKGRTNNLYFLLLITCCTTIVFRISFQLILRHCEYSSTNVFWARFVLYLYMICRCCIYSFGLLFVFSSTGILRVFYRSDTYKIILVLLFSVPMLYILMDCFKHIMFDIDKNMNIVLHPPIIVLNTCIVLTLFFGFLMILRYRQILNRFQVAYGLSLFPINGILFIAQSIFPQLQIEMFVLAITCYLAFATIQRPELLVNPKTLAQTSISFESELKKAMSLEVPLKLILIKITNYRNINMYVGNDKFSELLKKITVFLYEISHKEKLKATPFYLNDYVYVLPTENQTDVTIDKVLDTLERYFSQVFILDGVRINLDTRICVICSPEDVSNYEYLLYLSKTFYKILEPSGRPQWYRDYVSDRSFIIRNNIEKILDRAINEKLFEIYYQPIYSVETKNYKSAEALVRLNDPEYGTIPPALFINYAEKTNKIHVIGDYVIEKVCEFLGSEEGRSLNLDNIEVNMSVVQCFETDLITKIRTLLEQYKVEPSQLRLEITENAVSFNPQVIEKNIRGLNRMGINFSLDDYGTGFSNIKKLISLPFDIVKINKAFIDELDNPNTESLVQDTIHMLNSLGKKILIEGIEDDDKAEFFINLKSNDQHACEFLQGFYFSKPLPQSEFVKFIKK